MLRVAALRAVSARRALSTAPRVAAAGAALRGDVPDHAVRPFNTPGTYKDYIANNFIAPTEDASEREGAWCRGRVLTCLSLGHHVSLFLSFFLFLKTYLFPFPTVRLVSRAFLLALGALCHFICVSVSLHARALSTRLLLSTHLSPSFFSLLIIPIYVLLSIRFPVVLTLSVVFNHRLTTVHYHTV